MESDSNTTSPSRIFGPTPKVQLNHFLHHIPKLGIPVEMVQFILTLIETENSCCLPRFPLVTSCYKIVDSKKKKNSPVIFYYASISCQLSVDSSSAYAGSGELR